jgi:hypothetical protein
MPKFLSQFEIYRMLQRELPEDVYPDGAPSGFYSTADMDSVAAVAASGYAKLARIYDNMFPQYADESIADWELLVFGYYLDTALTLQQRRDKIVGKIRERRGLTIPDMIAVTRSVIGLDKDVEIWEWGCETAGWMIGVSQLSISTYLNQANLVNATGPTLCHDTPADHGMTADEWALAQEQAYTYDVRVYNYTLTAQELIELDAALNKAEPARSQHKIISGLTDADKIVGTT